MSKSDFIRSQPANLSTAEVVAKGKEAGIKLNRVLVYKVRAKGQPKKAASKKTAASAKSSVPTKAVSTKAVSKAAFVRGLPSTTPAKEVVAKAKAAGIKIGVSYVYNIRGAAKMAAKRKRALAKSPAVGPAVSVDGAGSLTSLLKAVAAEIGLGPAIDILRSERARVAAVIGG
jgi:hypothetical protein